MMIAQQLDVPALQLAQWFADVAQLCISRQTACVHAAARHLWLCSPLCGGGRMRTGAPLAP
jgi:hypothetical protein